jgi:hypothetical protein
MASDGIIRRHFIDPAFSKLSKRPILYLCFFYLLIAFRAKAKCPTLASGAPSCAEGRKIFYVTASGPPTGLMNCAEKCPSEMRQDTLSPLEVSIHKAGIVSIFGTAFTLPQRYLE